MPTYDYKCSRCDTTGAVFQSISEYSAKPKVPKCPGHGPMERKLAVVPGTGLNPLAGDRHYDGLRAPDGSDISTRTKHRQYMREKGVTMASDYTNTWKEDAKKREKLLKEGDSTIKRDIIDATQKLNA